MHEFNKTIVDEISQDNGYIVETRRYLHKYPELTAKEFKTSEFLKSEIKKLGLEIHEVKGTGFYAILDTGKEGKTLGIRSDIDALPINENACNLKQQKVSVSENEGVMHACGHDGHMAILLEAAKFLTKHKDELKGKVIFIFEEGEEAGTGIAAMLESLRSIKIDAIYGTHVTSFMDTGTVNLGAGPVMAGAAGVSFVVNGRGGHGSRPDLSISPIFAAANIITGLASAWVNQIDVTKTVTLGLGAINGGKQGNVIPDSVAIEGSLRFYDMAEGEKAVEILKKVATNIAAASNCTVDFSDKTKIAVGPVINDSELSEIAVNGVRELGNIEVKEDVQWFASESFSRYRELAPTLFAFVGIRNKELGSGAEHHNEYFDLDEDGLKYGAMSTVKFAHDFLNK